MLKRIQKIRNIGRFTDCCPPGCEFTKETIIFGFNTQGKSTLTSIFRSIQTGDNDILIGRKTFGATTEKRVEIDFEESSSNNTYVFQSRSWNRVNPNILIFDSKFIAENIFDGESITFDQQKNLNTIIIGKKGQDLNKEIIALQNKSDDFARQKGERTRELAQHFPTLDFNKFNTFSEDEDIDKKIASKDAEIKFEKEKGSIKSIIEFHIQNISGLDFSIRDTFEKTLDVKQEEIECHIKSHFSKEENAQNFLNEGLDFLKEPHADESPRACVFCGQDLATEAEALIKLYSDFFKGGYKELQNEMNIRIQYFKGKNIEAMLERITADLKIKGLDIGLSSENIAKLSKLKKEFEKELDKKRDLNYRINFEAFDGLKTDMEEIKTNLEKLKRDKVDTLSQKPLMVLEAEKRTLEIQKKRYEPVWVEFCKNFKDIEKKAEEVRAAREIKRAELDAHSSAIFNTHKETINRLCRDMSADFEVEDFKPLKKIVGTNERIFAIKFFGNHKVSIDNEDNATPNFRNTLSESDKRLLAFSFFLSLLLHDKELDKKIVVFDDPMSSFDSERLRKTIHLITDISCKYNEFNGAEKCLLPKQKIILTHQDRFAKELKRLMPDACTLKIKEYVEDQQKRSSIERSDFSQDFPDDNISHKIEKIKEILDERSFATQFESDCREVLEHIFKRKYCLDLQSEISRRKSVRIFTMKLAEDEISDFNNPTKYQKFIRLCDDLNIELHDGDTPNSNGDKESILRDFFECLREI